MRTRWTYEQAVALGFDQSAEVGRYVQLACSQCNALAINGHPTHETGCPNAMHECAGCNELIPARQRYCADCA